MKDLKLSEDSIKVEIKVGNSAIPLYLKLYK